MKYRIEVTRTESKTLAFDVNAGTRDEAIDEAEQKASMSDYSDAGSGSAEYESVSVEEIK